MDLQGRGDAVGVATSLLASPHPTTLIIEGAEGMGRTAVIHAVVRLAAARGWEAVVVGGAGTPWPPNAGWPEMLGGPMPPATRPRIVAVDDLDLAPDGLGVELAAAASGAAPPWSLLLVSARPRAAATAPLRGLIDGERVRAISLGPLDVTSALSLLLARAPLAALLSPRLAQRLMAGAEGSPRRLVELAARLEPRHRPRHRRLDVELALHAVRAGLPQPAAALAPGPPLPREQARRLRRTLLEGWAAQEAGEPGRAAELAAGVLSPAARTGDAAAAAHAQALTAVAAAELGLGEEMQRRSARAVAACRRAAVATGEVVPALAEAMLLAARPGAAVAHALTALAALGGSPPCAAHARAALILGWCRWRAGALDEAERALAATVQLDHLVPALRPYRLALAAVLAADRGDTAAGRQAAAQMPGELERTGSSRAAAWGSWAVGRALANLGSPDLSGRWLDAAVAAFRGSRSVAGEAACLPDVVEAELARGGLARAEAAVLRLEELSRRRATPLDIELASRSRALIAIAGRDGGAALTSAHTAVAGAVSSPVERVRSLRVLSLACGACGLQVDAARALDAALRLARSVGAHAEAERVQRSLGRSRPGPREALSEREREVARLIADGLTNRAIALRLSISHRTVDHHVARVLTKLGFSNRAQVAAWVGGEPPSGALTRPQMLPMMARA